MKRASATNMAALTRRALRAAAAPGGRGDKMNPSPAGRGAGVRAVT